MVVTGCIWRRATPGSLVRPLASVLFGVILLVAPQAIDRLTSRVWAQTTAQQPLYSREQLDQMLAPIALYPDALLAQVLMAATYPLEVVQAARWVKSNPSSKGDAATRAVQNESWDVSVKSLVAFPQILFQMDAHLDWTQKLGDAMLAQQADVAASIQRLRNHAYTTGKLKSSSQQKVSVEQTQAADGTVTQIIVIEPADPQIVYVPVYEPIYIYDPWPYPSWPPVYYPPWPGSGYDRPYVDHRILCGAGIVAAAALFTRWNWRGGDVNINIDRAVNIDRNFNRGGGDRWQHQPEHRKGAPYRDNASRQRYGAAQPGSEARREYRGKAPAQGAGPGIGAGAGQRPSPGAVQRPAAPATVQRGTPARPPQGGQGGAFDGVKRGGSQINREYSRGSSSYGRMGGGSMGGGRGMGGGGMGGGGRGGGRR